MWTVHFWKDAGERAIKTAAQTALASLFVTNVPVWELDWSAGIGVTVTATVASVLTSIVSSGRGSHQSASLVSTVDDGYVGEHRANG